MAGIYIHIPFCKQACYYCDFHFSTFTDNRHKMIESLCQELSFQKEYLAGQPIETIYFGGGTPSLLEVPEIEKILERLYANFPVIKNPEITLEANPDDLSNQKLSALHKTGVNRLSIGIQSFDDAILKFLHRAHDSQAAIESFRNAREAGFENISIDLIYAIPQQDHDLWKKNITTALALNPDHLSAYSLTIEEKTVFGQWKKKNKLADVDEQTSAEQLEILIEKSEAAGFDHYEVSNFSKPGFHSIHNSSYWKQIYYLGIGPGAHSYNSVSRQYNISNNPLYIKSLEDGRIPFELEMLTRENKINEYLFTTLRTTWGCDLNFLKREYQFDLEAESSSQLDQFFNEGLLLKEGTVIRLTKKGILFADKISSDLFFES
jgi:oxygen-independent coproporphyrinogen-3 oxidase